MGPNGEVKLADFGMAKHVCNIYFLLSICLCLALSIIITFSFFLDLKCQLLILSECSPFCTAHNLFAYAVCILEIH